MNVSRKLDDRTKLFVMASLCLIILIILTVFVFKLMFLNKNNESKHNRLLYVQLLNDSFPLIKASNNDDEVFSEDNITITGEALKLIGIDLNNPISIVGKEITVFNVVNADGSTNVSQNTNLKVQPFSLSDEQISKNGSSTGSSVNVQDPSLKTQLNEAKPEVLIYHTHTTESFQPNGTDNSDPDKNICAVGEALANNLENNYGISVINDTTIHNMLYTRAYYRSAETVDSYLKKYGDFKLIIDMHRDASSTKSGFTAQFNGESLAKFMFVLTKKNPHYDKNAAVAAKIKGISDRLFPGLCRDMWYYNYGSNFFNQQKSNNAVLIEVGSNMNTQTEALNTTKYLARIIAEYINGKK